MSRRGENIYRRKDGRWEGRYPKGRKPNGRIHYGYVYGKQYREVKQKIVRLKQQYQINYEQHGQSALAFSQWGEIWLQDIRLLVKASTFSSYKYKLEK